MPAHPYHFVTLWDIVRALKPNLVFGILRDLTISAQLSDAFEMRQSLRESLEKFRAQCTMLDLSISYKQASRLIQALDDLAPSDIAGAFERGVNMLSNTVEDEMSEKRYFEVLPHKAKWLVDNQAPFGESVAERFPSTTFDAAEAARSYAFGRNTACVFHLMRVLELGLATFAKEFDISSSHTNWAPVIAQIESRVREMHKDERWKSRPNCKDQQEFYSQAVSHLGVVKDAWRNHTVHARGKYDDQDAVDILTIVRAFMQKLSVRLSELPPEVNGSR